MDEPSHPPVGPDGSQQPPQQPDPFQQAQHGAPPPPGVVPAYVVAARPTNGWKVATIILSVLLGLATLVIAGLVLWIAFAWFGGGYYAYGDFDDDGEYDVFTASDTVLEEPCDRFADLAGNLPIFTAAEAAAPSVAELGDAAHDVADAARGLDVDESDYWALDADDWADGWDDLGDALDDFAVRLADDPDARLDIPRWSGGPATVSLGWEGPEGCEIPPVVSALDPELADEIFIESW